ncbi:transcription antitermination factor NusB [Undibacterium sp. RTI2.1]|uniref:transcription antitermination factor NusB n=1 Tax=unclassified Undibacterium TaxID=2630295 RepID=UPI002AB3EABF|nr:MULTISPECIES: transcription antitermination factor NusB [unclassified Undibacterium]MDY7538089.1 transcription antitermination factor NusB [Undibacterium sp. 5I1]MEB0032473.1 transcription antitermination factor NusB [Undibacterium sp. RTI2.1]MEB0118505.1 transcription antitermination factor NusB [Undibacterium sp. RTI2.2]MEB0232255.1 transcription antitermination factor NusB [Undibacterium sp. 10I3]MEB0259486.1 transcription antitermination factor NusB [Undibacterium sp. 5I1]
MTSKQIHANPSKSRSPRHRAREFALQGLYQWLLNNEDSGVIDAHIRQAHGFDKADREHFDALLHGAIKQSIQLREEIAPLIDRTIAELSPIEHAALLIGAYELKHHIEIPYRVVINEAVELTKSFGGLDGHKYVNGVLDKLAARLRATEISAGK